MTTQITVPYSLYQRIKVLDKKGKNLTYEWFKNIRDSYTKQKCYINGSENLFVLNIYFTE